MVFDQVDQVRRAQVAECGDGEGAGGEAGSGGWFTGLGEV